MEYLVYFSSVFVLYNRGHFIIDQYSVSKEILSNWLKE